MKFSIIYLSSFNTLTGRYGAVQLKVNRGTCDISGSGVLGGESGSKGSLDFFVRDFRFRPARRRRRRRERAEGREEKREKKRRRPGRPSHLPRICRATDFSVRCITHLLSAGDVVAGRRGWEPLNRGVPVVPLVECGPARCVRVHTGVCTHVTHTQGDTYKRMHSAVMLFPRYPPTTPSDFCLAH